MLRTEEVRVEQQVALPSSGHEGSRYSRRTIDEAGALVDDFGWKMKAPMVVSGLDVAEKRISGAVLSTPTGREGAVAEVARRVASEKETVRARGRDAVEAGGVPLMS